MKRPPSNLIDPISQKKYKITSPYDSKILELTPWQSAKLSLKDTFINVPKAVYHGLRGDDSYTFSDFLKVANIPYYLGGAFLALSFAAGRDKVNFVRQAIGVGLYYLGVGTSNKIIDKLYQWRYGIDLAMKYRKPNGNIEKVFASADFPRFDLLNDAHYQTMQKKMGIPSNVADPKREVNREAQSIISASRAYKLILGNLLAALGAGYLARSNGWARLLGNQSTFKAIWKDSGSLPAKIGQSFTALGSLLSDGVKEKITGLPSEKTPWLRKGVMATALGIGAFTLWQTMTTVKPKNYESPAIGFTKGIYPTQPSVSLNSSGAFSAFQQARFRGNTRMGGTV